MTASVAGSRRLLGLACALVAVLALAFALLPGIAHAAKSSSSVAYVYDFGSGSNDTGGPGIGSSIWVNALTGTAPGSAYTTADGSKTVSITDVPVEKIDEEGETALASFDTVIVYQVCNIGEHSKTLEALNTFLNNGGKVMISDADRCAPGVGGLADYSKFLFPFTTSSPGPKGARGSYTNVVSSTLTTGLEVGPQENDAVGDANIFTSSSGSWCSSITAKNALETEGFVEATARTAAGGLVIYEGEDFWFTDEPDKHLRLVFDNELEQNWDPDGLPCTVPASGISLSPEEQTQEKGKSATVTAKVVDLNGKPVPSTTVHFSVNSGPNAGKTGEATTNESGEASFTYPDEGGTGKDSLTASFTTIHEEPIVTDTSKVKPLATTTEVHTSNVATVEWVEHKAEETKTTTSTTTTPAPPPPTPKSGVLSFGTARLASSGQACVASSGYLASVRGTGIASVTYTLDGHKLKTLSKANAHGTFALRIHLSSGHRHHLAMKVTFTAASHTSALTLHKTLARCAAVRPVVTPRFTG